MNIHASNLAIALLAAITAREAMEAGAGYGMPSALLQGWRDALEALRRGEQINVIGSV